MGVSNKIESSFADLSAAERGSDSESAEEMYVADADEYVDWGNDEVSSPKGVLRARLLTAALLVCAAAWIAAFILSRLAIPTLPFDRALLAHWVGEVNAFAIPLALIAVLLLFVHRGSAAEARRFAKTSSDLEAAHDRLAETLASAATSLATNRTELEEISGQLADLGAQSSQQLVNSAATIQSAFATSSKAAEQMQTITGAAVSNLDRLRSQVPVLTNSAKDLTNAIAHAGGGAAEHVRDLSLMLTQIAQQSADIGEGVKTTKQDVERHLAAMADQMGVLQSDFARQIQDRRGEAEALFGSIGSNMDENGARLIAHLAEADVRVSALMQEAQNSVRSLSNLVTNNAQIATQHSQHMLAEIDETVQHLGDRIDTLLSNAKAKSAAQVEQLAGDLGMLNTSISQSMATVSAEQNAQVAAMASAISETNMALTQCSEKLSMFTAAQRQELHDHLAALNDAVAQVAATRVTETQQLQTLLSSITAHIDVAETRMLALSDKGADHSARLAFAFETSGHTFAQLSDLMSESEGKIGALLAMNAQLRDNIALTSDAISETLPGNLNRFGERLSDVKEAIAEQSSLTRDLENQGERLVVQFRKVDRLIAEQTAAMERLNTVGLEGMQERLGDAKHLAGLLTDIRRNLSELDGAQAEELLKLSDTIKAKVESDIAELTQQVAAADLSPTLEAKLQDLDINTLAATQVDALASALQSNLTRIEQEQSATLSRLEARYARLSEMAEALGHKANENEGQFGTLDEEGFARRMALLTESLNSAAIDVAKILSNEVTDTAWQHYLKGDRGVFTRRAVRLLSQQEVRVIARHYDEDGEFRTQVNRYIHDFEAMMRVLLSTRDGHVVSVTLLSSDVGKLYVALAQAIERLRQ